MDTATRAFIFAALVYLALGGLLGLGMAVVPGAPDHLSFTHVHLLLGGFMAMMVFGVGYFILPRFAGTALRWPRLVGVHFWMANLSLLAMAIARPLDAAFDHPAWGGLFHTGALVQAVTFLLFAANLGLTLLAKKPAAAVVQAPSRPAADAKGAGSLPAEPRPAPARAALGPETAVADIVDRKEGARELLVEAGLTPLQNPGHLEMVRKVGVSLGHACTRHGIPLEPLLERLNGLPDRAGADPGEGLTPDDVIGRVVERYPAAREVLQRRFGEGCFTCPGFNSETLAQGAMMHGVPVEELIAELESVRRRDG
jgi:hybrid cluster-associated redox disulfide protein